GGGHASSSSGSGTSSAGGAPSVGSAASSSDSATSGSVSSGSASSGSASSSSAASGSSSSGSGGAPLADPCRTGIAMKAESTYCACYNDPACGMLIECLAKCGPGDAQCSQTCATKNMAGISEAALVGDCGATDCAAECPNAAKLTPCEHCAAVSCSSQLNK